MTKIAELIRVEYLHDDRLTILQKMMIDDRKKYVGIHVAGIFT